MRWRMTTILGVAAMFLRRGLGRGLCAGVLVTAALSVGACGSSGGGGSAASSSGAPTGSQRLVVALPSDPSTLDPQLADDGSERMVNDSIYETLLTRDAAGNLQPLLAVAMPQQINRTTWRFKLRHGVKFTNGEPFDADAVVASVKRVLDPKYASGQLGFFGGMKTARKVGAYSVDIITAAEDPLLPARMAFMKMVPPKYSQSPQFAKQPIGTGPYLFVSRTVGESIDLKANPNYWGKAPSIKTVQLRTLEDESAALAALKSGAVDLVTNLSPDYAHQVPKFLHVPGAENTNILLDNKDGGVATDDVRVRQAMNYAIDKQAIAQKLYDGYASPLKCSTVPPQAFGYDPNLQPYPYDPAKAKALIQQAGATGKTVTFVSTPSRWLKAREVSEAVASYIEATGLKVNLEFHSWNKYLEDITSKSNRPELIYHSSSNDLLDADRQISSYYDSSSSLASYHNPKVDALAVKARSEKDKATRLELYNQLEKTACDDASHIFLVNIQDMYGTSTRLQWTPRRDQRILYKDMTLQG